MQLKKERLINFRNTDLTDDVDDTVEGAGPGHARLSRVSLVDRQPTPVLLASYVFLADGEWASPEWMAADPFGLGLSDGWRAAVR